MTLQEAREELQRGLKDGTVCPCCDRYTQIYKRKISGANARALVAFYKYARFRKSLDLFLHLRDVANEDRDFVKSVGHGSDFPKLRFWGLLERQERINGDRKTSGYFRLTDAGIQFVERRITVPMFMYLYNDKAVGSSDIRTTIDRCFKEKFSYHELMGHVDWDPSGDYEPPTTQINLFKEET